MKTFAISLFFVFSFSAYSSAFFDQSSNYLTKDIELTTKELAVTTETTSDVTTKLSDTELKKMAEEILNDIQGYRAHGAYSELLKTQINLKIQENSNLAETEALELLEQFAFNILKN